MRIYRWRLEHEKFSESYDKEEIGQFLRANGASDSVAEGFIGNLVNGRTFLMLTDDDLKQLVPPPYWRESTGKNAAQHLQDEQ